MFFAADVAVVLTAGADPFRIPLGLHAATVASLLDKVLAIQPSGSLPAITSRALPGPPPGPPPGAAASGGPSRFVPTDAAAGSHPLSKRAKGVVGGRFTEGGPSVVMRDD